MGTSIDTEQLIHVFHRLGNTHGLTHASSPVLRTDNGSEFLGAGSTQWAKSAIMANQYIQVCKPNQDTCTKRFNSTLRNDLLDRHLYVRLQDIREAAYWRISSTTNSDPVTRSATSCRSSMTSSPEPVVLNWRLEGEGSRQQRFPT